MIVIWCVDVDTFSINQKSNKMKNQISNKKIAKHNKNKTSSYLIYKYINTV